MALYHSHLISSLPKKEMNEQERKKQAGIHANIDWESSFTSIYLQFLV
jgi:hypothetical protein